MRKRQGPLGLSAKALLAALLCATSLQGQVNQHGVAQQLLGGNRGERSSAVRQAWKIGPQNAGAELRAALITLLDKNTQSVAEAAQRQEPVADIEDPEFITQVAHLVSQLGDPQAIPALARALGTGSTMIHDALADFGEQAMPEVLQVVRDERSPYAAVDDGLITLRFVVEGAGGHTVSAGTHDEIRHAAIQRLTGKQYFTTLWRAIDLAIALGDPELRRTVQAIASDRHEVVDRGLSAPDIIELTQKRAAARLAGVPAQPHYRTLAERGRLLNAGRSR